MRRGSTPRPAALERRRRAPRQGEQARLQSKAYNLELDVLALRQRVRQLTQTRRMLATRAFARHLARTECAVRTVLAYFDAVQDGVPDQTSLRDPVAFLTAALAESFTLGPASAGLDARVLVHQWRLYTRLFRLHGVRVDALHVIIDAGEHDGPVVKATGGWSGVVTRDAVLQVFPHLVDNEPLIARVVGRRIATHGHTLFCFDAQGRIARCDVHVDLFRAFAELLQDPALVLELLRDARIGQQSTLGTDASGGQDPPLPDRRDGQPAAPPPPPPPSRASRCGSALSLDYILS